VFILFTLPTNPYTIYLLGRIFHCIISMLKTIINSFCNKFYLNIIVNATYISRIKISICWWIRFIILLNILLLNDKVEHTVQQVTEWRVRWNRCLILKIESFYLNQARSIIIQISIKHEGISTVYLMKGKKLDTKWG